MRTSGRTTHIAGITALITAIVLAFGSSSALAQPKSDDGWGFGGRLLQYRALCRKQADEQHLPRGLARRAFVRNCVKILLAGNYTPPGGVSVLPAPPWNPWINREAEFFAGGNIGGQFQNTNFSVSDTGFNVNGSGLFGGGFGGALFPVPNTNVLFGPRFGIQGGNITGSISAPAASPLSDYKVTTSWTAYQEGMGLWSGPRNWFGPTPTLFGSFFTGGVGVAESGTSVKGTSGTFSFTDNAVRTGMTFTAGWGAPVATLPNGIPINLFVQYRGIQWISTVNIPGPVPISSYTSEVSIGLIFPFSPLRPHWGPEGAP